MIFIFIFLIELIAVFFLYKKCEDMYEGLENLDESEFRLKKLMPIGLFLIQDVFKYGFDKPADIKTQSKLGQLYGARYAGKYLRLIRAHQVCICILGILIVTFLAGAMQLSVLMEEKSYEAPIKLENNTITRPQFGEGTKNVNITGTYHNEESNEEVEYMITVGEQLPDDNGCVDYAMEHMDEILLKGNSDFEHIKTNLKFSSKVEKVGVKIDWKVPECNEISSDGVVIRPENGEGDKIVDIKAVFKKGDVSKEKVYKLTILQSAPLTAEEEIKYAQKYAATQMEGINGQRTEAKIELPSKIKNVKINWKIAEEKSNNAVTLFAFGILVTFLIIFLNDRSLDEKIKKKREQIQIDYPEFLNKLTILLTSGFTMIKALEKIAGDYINISNKTNKKRALYEELVEMVSEINGGKVFSEAVNNFALRCKTREMLKFASIIELNQSKGSGELVLTLNEQAVEAWESRKNVAKRRGEEASTKLLIPLMLMLVGILVIVMIPAVMSLSGL